MLGERLSTELGGFWFPSRESPEGVALGFPDALVMLSPFGAVLEAIATSNLPKLDDVTKDIRTSLAQAKFSGAGAARLQPQDYQTLFDPGYLQLMAIDPAKVDAALKLPPDRLAMDIREALTRTQLPDQARKQVEAQLVTALGRLERGKPMMEQVSRAPRLAELVMRTLFGATMQSGSAPEELWADIAFPLLFIGTPEKFPEIDGEELELAKRGVDPFLLFLEVCPYATQAPEDGLMGAFPANTIDLPHKSLAGVGQPRVVTVGLEAVKGPLEKFDPVKTKECIERLLAKRFKRSQRGRTSRPGRASGQRDARGRPRDSRRLQADRAERQDRGHAPLDRSRGDVRRSALARSHRALGPPHHSRVAPHEARVVRRAASSRATAICSLPVAPDAKAIQPGARAVGDIARRRVSVRSSRQRLDRLTVHARAARRELLHQPDGRLDVVGRLAWQPENEVDVGNEAFCGADPHGALDGLDVVAAVARAQDGVRPRLAADDEPVVVDVALQHAQRFGRHVLGAHHRGERAEVEPPVGPQLFAHAREQGFDRVEVDRAVASSRSSGTSAR